MTDAEIRMKLALQEIADCDDIEVAKVLAKKSIGDDYDSRMLGSLTSSPIGSLHWFNTLCARILHDAEYIRDNADQAAWNDDVEKIEKYSTKIMKTARHLIDNFDKIPYRE